MIDNKVRSNRENSKRSKETPECWKKKVEEKRNNLVDEFGDEID